MQLRFHPMRQISNCLGKRMATTIGKRPWTHQLRQPSSIRILLLCILKGKLEENLSNTLKYRSEGKMYMTLLMIGHQVMIQYFASCSWIISISYRSIISQYAYTLTYNYSNAMRDIQKSKIIKYLTLLLGLPQTSPKYVPISLHLILSVKIGHKILFYFWHHNRKRLLMPLTYSFIFLYL